MVGALNMISVAFAVLFVGLGVDFAIQFSRALSRRAPRGAGVAPRAGASRRKNRGAADAWRRTAVAAGFLSFLPTDYEGVSELGQIAGVGMLVAYHHEHHRAAGLI